MDKNILLNDLSKYRIKSIEPFSKGWSSDNKYIALDDTGIKYLLRLSPITAKDRVLTHAEFLEQCRKNDIPTHSLTGHGNCLKNQYYFLLLEWINGKDAEEKISSLSKDEQYELGIQAGKFLQKIHNFELDMQPRSSWPHRYNKKIDNKIEMYKNCELKYDKGHLLLETVEKYRGMLKEVAIVPHHGDYHVGNMLIDANNQLYIIDFDRHDHGDPWEEFNRITWCVEVSHEFASGQINGYFNNEVSKDFWKLLMLYITTNALSSLSWAIKFGEKEIRTMTNGTAKLLETYDDFNKIIPSWYVERTHI
ncbi:aminoglycoside phosphotransferase family protein [Salinicoccus sp. HZC-1]|uniref:aminoglycoside phosphotransferase family protein n=1 Tax=Salinicoccus sp. HZC-1 TaxID=3385497 RepID=UPI00398AB477